MLLGFNHNIRYKDKVFHVQTEDNGLDDPDLVTQVFLGGQIVAIERSSYSQLLAQAHDSETRDAQIRKLMQEQHKRLLKNLVRGDYDMRLALGADAGSEVITPRSAPRIDDLEPETHPAAKPVTRDALEAETLPGPPPVRAPGARIVLPPAGEGPPERAPAAPSSERGTERGPPPMPARAADPPALAGRAPAPPAPAPTAPRARTDDLQIGMRPVAATGAQIKGATAPVRPPPRERANPTPPAGTELPPLPTLPRVPRFARPASGIDEAEGQAAPASARSPKPSISPTAPATRGAPAAAGTSPARPPTAAPAGPSPPAPARPPPVPSGGAFAPAPPRPPPAAPGGGYASAPARPATAPAPGPPAASPPRPPAAAPGGAFASAPPRPQTAAPGGAFASAPPRPQTAAPGGAFASASPPPAAESRAARPRSGRDPIPASSGPAVVERSLDDLILSYLYDEMSDD